MLPGDPARMMLGQSADSASVAAVKKELGTDKPLYIQFACYLNDLSPFSFHTVNQPGGSFNYDALKYGIPLFALASKKYMVAVKYPCLRQSYQTRRNVSELLVESFINTFILAMVAMAFALVAGAFVLAHITHLNMAGSLYSVDDLGRGEYLDLKNLILPALTLGIRPLAIIVELTRNSLLEVLSQDYIRTAKAKGLSPRRIIFKHALKNALNPVVTAATGWLASLLAGAVFVEYIFDWKGIGLVIVNALDKYDFPVIMGAVLFISVILILINILADILYGVIDPRVRIKS
ncbi:MAG: ABC transporter permease [Bacteroidetes bacterium]|nr:ABC transporter permease [Bacteroidota bacterium]